MLASAALELYIEPALPLCKVEHLVERRNSRALYVS
jgi:hypothetical protein